MAAYTSFTLRKQTVGYGSNLQQAGATDSALQADGISSAVVIDALTTGTNTFTANIIARDTVRLEWTLEDPLVATVTSGYQPVELYIVSSFSGEPVTIRDGTFVKSITSETLDTYYDDVPEVSQGRWVYYSLFVKYSTSSTYWFTRVATLYIQIPIAYNSVEALWSKVPQYYRELDYQQQKLSEGYTPLYAFLELFGNEVDRTRTLVETIALSNDPELAVTPALSQLAYETGLEITVDDLGTSKVRTLLNNIGTLRQQKGTIGSICSYISAMSGCPVTYTYNAALPKPHVFTVYAQRVNFISDPEFRNATITTSSGTVTQDGTTYYAKLQTTNTWGIYSYGTNTMGASNPVIVTDTTTGITLTMPANTYDTRTVMIYPRKPFPYLGTSTYGTSYTYSSTLGASFSALHTSTDATRLAWEAGITGASMPTVLFADNAWYSGIKYAYNDTSNRPSLEYIPSTTGASVTVSSVPVLVFQMAPGSSISISDWLFEPSTNNDYFSGRTREGGYIPIQDGTTGGGTFDYYWDTAQGGADQAFSYYLSDHERTIKTTERVIGQYIVPVTMLALYSISWDYYPGK